MASRRHVLALALAVVGLLVAGGLALALREGPGAPPDPDVSAPGPSEPGSSSTTEPPLLWPPLAVDGVARAVTSPAGLVLAVVADRGDGTYLVQSPCGNEVEVAGTPLSAAHVVLDPGHGGADESGAVGPAGTREKDVNLAVARATQRLLETAGAIVVLTRTADYRITLASRAAIATALQPAVFISIHHNAEPDELRATPGAETYFQIASPESRRAAGLVYEELVAAFAPYEGPWGADLDAGAKYRAAGDGGDYYGILRRTAGVPAVLSEAAFLSNPAEEALLVDPAFQLVQAEALARAVVRFVTTDDPGGGFVEPYPRTAPAGPGGGAAGCVDPAL